MQQERLDSLDFSKLDFPYDRITGELDPRPRLVRGQNVYVTAGGKLGKRPGTLFQTDSHIDQVCHRAIINETVESPPKVYIIGSFFNTVSGKYEIKYIRFDATTPAWTTITNLRNINDSVYPHEMVEFRGKCFIKGFPSSGDKLAAVIFDGTGGTVKIDYWGILGPLEPAHVVDPLTWSLQVNAHAYTVRYGWKYVYAWVSRTGQISVRSPLETNPDKRPSDTGAVTAGAGTGRCPEIKVTGHADTTLVPYINIYRSTDGGGTFYFVDQIVNTGAVEHTYVDKFLESGASGGVFQDPKTDASLDILNIAPSEESNLPPPAQMPPRELGVDPVERSSPLCVYSNRIWFAIGNYLFYSADEEIDEGNQEECFPIGFAGLTGNFFKFSEQITQLIATTDALYVMTLRRTYRLTGTEKEAFNLRQFLPDVGAPIGHPRSATSVGNKVIFLTHDFRIGQIEEGSFSILSDELFTDIVDAVGGLGQIEIVHWAELDKDYLVVASHRPDDTEQSRQWICDLRRSAGRGVFWFVPWTIRATSIVSGRLREVITNRRLAFFVWDGTDSVIAYLDASGRTPTDYLWSSGATSFTWYFETHLMTNPAGNHLNSVNVPARTPSVKDFRFDMTRFADLRDPRVYVYFDDFWTDPKGIPILHDPPRRRKSKAYLTRIGEINQACQRVALKFQQVNDPNRFEMHNFMVNFEPGGGT